METKRPFVFVGSSSEGLETAKAVQANLEYSCECQIWSQGVFGLGEGAMEALIRNLGKYDFAVLVLTPDDIVVCRGETSPMARDNVLFELGLFIGKIGRDRTFMITDRDAGIKIPSDLSGISPATFMNPQSGTLQSALGTACTTIEERVKVLGCRSDIGIRVEISGAEHYSIHASDLALQLDVKNVGDVNVPPYFIQLAHPKLGRMQFFHTTISGSQLPGQVREHKYFMFRSPPGIGLHLPNLTHDNGGQPLGEVDDEQWSFQLVLEHSDKVLYQNSRLAKALVTVLRKVLQERGFENLTHAEMMGLQTDA